MPQNLALNPALAGGDRLLTLEWYRGAFLGFSNTQKSPFGMKAMNREAALLGSFLTFGNMNSHLGVFGKTSALKP